MTEPDYILIARTYIKQKYLVGVMRWDVADACHVMRECSNQLTLHGARHLAHEWAKEKGLEVRE